MLFGLLSISGLGISVNRSFFVHDSNWLPSCSHRVFFILIIDLADQAWVGTRNLYYLLPHQSGLCRMEHSWQGISPGNWLQ